MLKEFREFAVKGNVIDLAVGVVIGAAFGKIVTSLVEDLIMPLVGLVVGKIDFSNLFVQLSKTDTSYPTIAAAKAAGAATLSYGVFLNNVVNFLIISFSIFVVVKQINRFKREEAAVPAAPAAPAAPPEPTATEKLLGEIRDLLAKK